jgi:hypothetical protein
MRSLKNWLLGALVLAALDGALMVIDLSSPSAVAAEQKAGDHWQNFDGHWSFWHEGDKSWYYTDGVHWYHHSPTGWVLYHFDKLFGKTGFQHGDYKPPVDRAVVDLPRHDVYHR